MNDVKKILDREKKFDGVLDNSLASTNTLSIQEHEEYFNIISELVKLA